MLLQLATATSLEGSVTIIYGGLRFDPTAVGGMAIRVGHNGTENADIIRTVVLSPEEWQSLITATVEPEAKRPDFTPGAISTVPSDVAISLIKEAASLEELELLEQDELANQKNAGGRKGVLAAVADRRKELSQN
jgi:hypothetical protein